MLHRRLKWMTIAKDWLNRKSHMGYLPSNNLSQIPTPAIDEMPGDRRRDTGADLIGERFRVADCASN